MSELLFLGILVLQVVAFNAEGIPFLSLFNNKHSLNAKYETIPFFREMALKSVTSDSKHFSSILIQEVSSRINSKNQVISPLGLSLTLSMASYGAQRRSLSIFRNIVGIPYSTYVGKIGFQALIDDLANYKAVELHVANAVFVSSKIQPNNEFIEITTRAFRSAVQKVEFDKSTEAINIINEWCENKTHGHIKGIVNSDGVDADTSMVLVNAMYFKGTWMKKFDPRDTRELPFYVNGVTEKKIPTMSIEGTFRHGEYPEADAKFVEFPYKYEDGAHNMSMFVILPKKREGLIELEKNFHQITIEKLMKRGIEKKVYIQLPKFKIESEIDLRDPLTRMGMGNLFDPRTANFQGIVRSPPRLYLTKVAQKAIIEVNEAGCEAASSTAAVFSSRSAFDTPTLFFANSPFYVVIAATGALPLNFFTARFTGQEE